MFIQKSQLLKKSIQLAKKGIMGYITEQGNALEDNMIYTLKIYDTELMTFELTQKLLEGFCCQVVCVKEENKHLLPLGMNVNG